MFYKIQLIDPPRFAFGITLDQFLGMIDGVLLFVKKIKVWVLWVN